MSHHPERQEKICLNCRSVIYGRFCHICGQENIEPKETFWGLITHFVYDLTHFDGKFFATTRNLLTKPGYLSLEYLRGRRASYLNPIRMYIFTSAFFFVIFFSFIATSPGERFREAESEFLDAKVQLQQELNQEEDAEKRKGISSDIARTDSLLKLLYNTGIAPRRAGEMVFYTTDSDTTRLFNLSNLPTTLEQYDSLQLSEKEPDGWLISSFKRKIIKINNRYQGRRIEFYDDLSDKFKHSIPQMMFISLPLVALVLYFLNISRRRTFYYVNHVIFCVNLYIAVFILLLLYYLVDWLNDVTNLTLLSWLEIAIVLGLFYYIYRSMRNFYWQGRAKTATKFLLLIFSIGFLFSILLIVFGLNSLMQM